MRMTLLFPLFPLLIAAALPLSGCGTKTPLTLPPGSAVPPLLGHPASAPQPTDNHSKPAPAAGVVTP